MKILLLGDGHTYGYGLSARQLSYTGHFVRQLSRTGRSVTVETYAHLTLPESTALLTRLPLNQYDLIVFQPGPDLIQQSVPGSGLVLPGFVKRLRAVKNTLLNVAASVISPLACPGRLAQLLTLLRPYRHTVVLMTPFPCRTSLGQWQRERSRLVLLKEGMDQAFSVFDTGAVVQPREEYFLPGDDEHLNGVSHELIGRALFDFYQSAPTIVTVHATNRK